MQAMVREIGRYPCRFILFYCIGSVTLDRFALVLRTLIVVALVYAQVRGSHKRWNDMYGGAPAPVQGRWELLSIEIDKAKPAADDPMNWSWFDFSNRKTLRLAGPKPPTVGYLMAWDTSSKKLTLTTFRKPTWSATFGYNLPEPDMLELNGEMDGKAIGATLKRAPEKRHELMSRGIHWIQELPYNR